MNGSAPDVHAYQDRIDELAAELAETNRGVVALSLEVEAYREHLEDLVAERTAQLEMTQAELQQTNTELLMLTSELDSRIALRTSELTDANAELRLKIDEVNRARAQGRKSAERLELATQSAGLGAWEWEAGKDDLVWDETTFRLYGVADGADAATVRREELLADEAADFDLADGSPLLSQPRFDVEFHIRWPDTSTHVIASSGLVVKDERGTLLRVVGIDQDITGRVEAAAELDRYRSQLEELVAERTQQLSVATERANEANLAKSAFLANMSHELRTPMNAILGFADLLSTGDPSPAQREEYLSIISRSGKHLLALINDVLDMSKIESGRMELELEAVLVREISQEVVDLLRDRAAQKGLTLELVIRDGVPEAIQTDEVKLRQILLNLTSNAIKATARGAVNLTVESTVHPTTGAGMLRVDVADTGVGIAPEDLDRIFEPFQQVGPSLGGTGLGLSISRRFATLMGGDITVHSVVGEGTVFQVMVPAIETDVVPDHGRAAHRTMVGLEPGQEVRVLIAEDHKDSALLLSTLMEQAGIDVRVADDGELAVKAFDAFRPHLIWMDARMPVMDGLEAARRIRQRPGGADVVIIGVTASVFVDERTTLIDAGMDAVITKPVQAAEIYDCMTERLGTRFVFKARPEEAATSEGEGQVTGEQLAALPREVREALEDALLLLDSAQISSAVNWAASTDPDLGKALRSLTEALRYESILRALDEVTDGDT